MTLTALKSAIIAAVAASVAVLPVQALAGAALDRAVYAAVEQNKETKKVSTYDGHEFNIKPMSISSLGPLKGYRIKGQLSHHLSWRTDDQFYYEITIDDAGTILEMEEKIDRGGWTSMVLKLPVGQLVEGWTGGRVPTAATETAIAKAGRWLGGKLDGSWEGAARKVVIQIGLQVAARNALTPVASAARISASSNSGPAIRDHRLDQEMEHGVTPDQRLPRKVRLLGG